MLKFDRTELFRVLRACRTITKSDIVKHRPHLEYVRVRLLEAPKKIPIYAQWKGRVAEFEATDGHRLLRVTIPIMVEVDAKQEFRISPEHCDKLINVIDRTDDAEVSSEHQGKDPGYPPSEKVIPGIADDPSTPKAYTVDPFYLEDGLKFIRSIFGTKAMKESSHRAIRVQRLGDLEPIRIDARIHDIKIMYVIMPMRPGQGG